MYEKVFIVHDCVIAISVIMYLYVYWFRSLVRSLFKNFTIGFLFPLCIIQYTLSFNRAMYDVIANTVVIEGIF